MSQKFMRKKILAVSPSAQKLSQEDTDEYCKLIARQLKSRTGETMCEADLASRMSLFLEGLLVRHATFVDPGFRPPPVPRVVVMWPHIAVSKAYSVEWNELPYDLRLYGLPVLVFPTERPSWVYYEADDDEVPQPFFLML